MPARLARSSVQSAAPKNVRNKNRKRNLDAYAIASHQVTEKNRIKPSRLGEVLEDGPVNKRRRANDEDEDEGESEDDVPARGAKRSRLGPNEHGVEHGSDSEGNEWTLGGLASDDDDSDLDSDEAFGESDEEKFEGFTFRGSSGGKKKTSNKRKIERNSFADDDPEVDLDEAESDSDVDEDDFGDEGVDLATMLDDEDEDILGANDQTQKDLGVESPSDDDEDDESEESDSVEEEEDYDRDEERVARLRDRLEAMDKTEQSLTAKAAQLAQISVDDLLADLDPSARKQFAAAIKTKKKSEAPKTLTAPLPKRQQDRLDREAASKKAKEQLNRWRDTVIHNRRAEFLSFPLKEADREAASHNDKFAANNEPRNNLEEDIRKIMEESGMTANPSDDKLTGENGLILAEELETNKLPVEEVMRRRAELRKARELLFREEIKAKRIAKIKSKSYRRVHRKERERQIQFEREAREAAGLDGMDEDEQDRFDRRRAEERMSTKHRDSKWAKSLKATNRAVWDDGARDSVIEQARRNEELRRRIVGEDVANGETSEVSSDDDEEDGNDMYDERKTMFGRLDRIQRQDDGRQNKGLHNMKFMRDAEDRRRAQNDEDVQLLRKELAVEDEDESESVDEIHDQGLGRAIFGPKTAERAQSNEKTKRPEMEEGDSSEEDGLEQVEDAQIITERPGENNRRAQSTKNNSSFAEPRQLNRNLEDKGESTQHDNSWLDTPAEVANDKEDTNNSWLSSRTKPKRQQQRERILTDVPTLDLDTSGPVKRKNAKSNADSKPRGQTKTRDSKSQGSTAANTEGWTVVAHKNDEDNDDDVSDAESTTLQLANQSAQVPEMSLRARAFAGDDVHVAFQAEKDEAIASEDEKEVSNHLPGWGSWTGEGLSKSVRKSNARQRHNPLWKYKLAGIKPSDRQDAKLANVIISEKRETQGSGKKSSKYLAPVLPHGFEKKEQYERSLRVPMGPEWTTKETFQRSTRPRVVVKPGRVIEAMERPLM